MTTAAIVSIVGFSALMMTRVNRKTTQSGNDLHEARLLALTAIEHALTKINRAPDTWRTDFPHNAPYPTTPVAIGNGTFQWKLFDSDLLLNDDQSDPVTLSGIGRVGNAVYVENVLVTPYGDGMDCLAIALYSDKKQTLGGGTLICSQKIGTGKSCDASGGMVVDSDVEAAGGTTGGTFLGDVDNSGPTRSLPDDGTVFDYYISNGTSIPLTSLPLIGGVHTIDSVYIGPDNNPYGETANAKGIYVIDCSGDEIDRPIHIQNSRILGTLVLLNSPDTSKTRFALNWQPAVPNYPSAMIRGKMLFSHDKSTILDESALGQNFNPTEDSDTADIYATVIKGIVYSSVDLTFSGHASFNGAVVLDGQLHMSSGTADLIYDGQFLTNPPPGFASGVGGEMHISPDSWEHGESP